ncbi:MAG: hypothetical protein AB7J46_06175 [Candidatus Altimarinota bacterium]
MKKLNSPYNHYTIPQADYFIDCRCVPEHGLKHSGKGGKNLDLQNEMQEFAPHVFALMVDQIVQALERIEARRSHKKDPYGEPFKIGFLCAWGQTRSVASCAIVSRELTKLGYQVKVL